MSLSSDLNKHIYVGNGVTKTFDYEFDVLTEDDLHIYLTDTINGTEVEITSNYSVSPSEGTFPSSNGTVTYPSIGTAISSDYKLTIIRTLEVLQPTVYPNNTALKPKVVERSFDRITMIAQQQQEQIDRTLQFAITVPDDFNRSLPAPVALKALRINSDATAFEYTTDPEIAANQAAASAAAALASENNSATNATNAANSAATIGGFLDYTATAKTADIITKSPWIDVRAFNAIGNDLTDNTLMFQAAIDYLDGKAGIIRIGYNEGLTYRTKSLAIPSNVTLYLEKDIVLKQIDTVQDMTINGFNVLSYFPYGNISTLPLFLINGSNVNIINGKFIPSNEAFAIKDSDSVYIDNITIDGENNTKWNGINACFSTNIVIKNSKIKNCGVKLAKQDNGDGTYTNKYGYGYGIVFDNCSNINVNNNEVSGNGANNICAYNIQNIYINKNKIHDAGVSGIQILFPFYLPTASGSAGYYGTWTSQENTVYNVNILNNEIYDNGADACDINNNSGRTDGYLYNGTSYDYYSGLVVPHDSKITFRGNKVFNNGMINGVPVTNDGSGITLTGVSNASISKYTDDKSLNKAPAISITNSADVVIDEAKIIKENCQCILISNSDNVIIKNSKVNPVYSSNKELFYANNTSTNIKIFDSKFDVPSDATLATLITAYNDAILERNTLNLSTVNLTFLSSAKLKNNTINTNNLTYRGGLFESNNLNVKLLQGSVGSTVRTVFKNNSISGTLTTDGSNLILIQTNENSKYDDNTITTSGTGNYTTAFSVYSGSCKITNNTFNIGVTGFNPYCIKLDNAAKVVELGGNNYNNASFTVQLNTYPYSSFGTMHFSAVPTVGTYKVGDIVFNTTPNLLKNISHWECITSGTPGTWLAYGTGTGTTANRPTLTTNDTGYLYRDTTTSTIVFWNGTAWI